ncbi:transcription factor CP2-like protein 1 isoform X2 [Chelonus insularis]|uniref:transcription factor CP2-like protein 1 isoform X2 n=1 Tax=Chelonus insularis TaxID=460826 RepID=UPI00158C57E9|nr:transcription factor CP2-like protein 1 isoform X2 [Chelonus insularis]
MELQETGTDTLNETMWLDQSPSPSYQQLSPPVQQGGRNVVATQQISMGYQIPDGAILWHEKHESPRNSPDSNDPLQANADTRENSPSGGEPSTSYHQYLNNRKRRSNENNQINDLDRKYIKRDGSVGSNVSSQGWSSKQVEEFAEHLVADFDGSLSAIAANDLVNAVASYNMSLNHVSQRNINGSFQNGGNIGLLVEPDSNNNNNTTGNNVSTTTASTNNIDRENHHTTASGLNSRNISNNGKGQMTPYNFHQLLYSNNEEFSSSSSGNHVSSSQQESEFNGDTRFQYVLGAATSMAIKLTEETLTYLNQGQPYELKLKKLGDLSAYRGRILKSTIKICFHERRLQYTEREQMMAWQRARPGERLLEVDVPLSYGMLEVSQNSLPKNTVEITWDPTKEANVYIKINCISTEFTAKKHGGEKGVPFRIQVETRLCSGLRLHAASCQIKVFKLKGADRKHKQDQEKIRRKPLEKQELYQSSCECTVLTDVPLNLLPPSSPKLRNSQSPFIASDIILTQNIRNPGGGGSPSDSGQEDTSEGSPQMPRLQSPQAVLPDQTSNLDVNITGGLFELPENANPIQTSAWLRANGFQSLEATFRDYSASDFRHLTRNDLIEICGLVKGIQLYNRIKSRPLAPLRTLYFAVENNDSPVWKIVYLHNLTSEALTTELLSKFNLPQDRLHSIWVQGPRSIRILICNEIVENMKEENLYLIEIIKDSPNDRYKLLLKPFSHG